MSTAWKDQTGIRPAVRPYAKSNDRRRPRPVNVGRRLGSAADGAVYQPPAGALSPRSGKKPLAKVPGCAYSYNHRPQGRPQWNVGIASQSAGTSSCTPGTLDQALQYAARLRARDVQCATRWLSDEEVKELTLQDNPEAFSLTRRAGGSGVMPLWGINDWPTPTAGLSKAEKRRPRAGAGTATPPRRILGLLSTTAF
jgi:hypothetical protein